MPAVEQFAGGSRVSYTRVAVNRANRFERHSGSQFGGVIVESPKLLVDLHARTVDERRPAGLSKGVAKT